MGQDNTQLLKAMSTGDASAAKRLTPLVYDELRVLARRYLPLGSASGRTLEPTALVHEAFLRLVDKKTTDLRSQTHFYALAAGAMRHVLIDHVRNRKRAKVLLWDGTGLCVYAKRMEHGCFACLWRDPAEGPLVMTMSELRLFLEGSRLVGRVSLSPPVVERKCLVETI